MVSLHAVSVSGAADSGTPHGAAVALGVLALLVALFCLAIALRAGRSAEQRQEKSRNHERHGATSATLIRSTAGFCTLALGATALRLLTG